MPAIPYPRRLRRSALAVAVVSTFTGLAGLAAATPAQAEGMLCVYLNRNYNEAIQCFTSSGGQVGPVLDGRVSSVRNNTGVTMCLYDTSSRSSLFLPIGPGSRYSNLALNAAHDGRSWNDRVSGVYPAPC